MVMADRQTNSVWSHLDGEAIEGPMTGIEMSFLPLVHTTWEEWLDLQPDTTVLSFDTDFQSQYRTITIGMPNGRFARELLTVDDRLASEALVLGVMEEDVFVAYPVSVLEQQIQPAGAGLRSFAVLEYQFSEAENLGILGNPVLQPSLVEDRMLLQRDALRLHVGG